MAFYAMRLNASVLDFLHTGVIDIAKKKMTMQDIANIIGISKATVSYVLNNKPNARISEETRNRVLHVANLYNYSPNIIAKSLSSDLENPIGIVNGTGADDCWLYAQEQTALVQAITVKLKKIERNIVLLDPSSTLYYPVEAIIGINLSREEIMNLSQKVFVPLLLLDSFVSDTLFYQFNIDYMYALGEAARIYGEDGFSCVFSPYRNEQLRQFLCGHMAEGDILFCKDPAGLREYICDRRAKHKKILFFNSAAALLGRDMLTSRDYMVVTSDTIAGLFFSEARSFSYSVDEAAGVIIELLIELCSRHEEGLPSDHLQKIPLVLNG